MTKLALNLGEKKGDVEGGETTPKEYAYYPEKPAPETLPYTVPDSVRSEYGGAPRRYTGFDWHFIWRTAHFQFLFAMISSFALLTSFHFTGFNVFRFTSSAWATYLACVAIVGIRAGRQRNYAYLVAYTGMVTFQTMIYMSSLCWMAYSLYALDYHATLRYYPQMGMSAREHDFALILIVVEILTLLGTVFTGVFGVVAVCKGFGMMLQDIEAFILKERYPTAQITVHPLV